MPFFSLRWGIPNQTGVFIMPDTLRCGDSWSFGYPTDYAASGAADGPWNATMYFAVNTDRLTAAGTSDGRQFNFLFAAADTKTFPPGPAQFAIVVDNLPGLLQQTVDQGPVLVQPDLTDPNSVIDPTTPLEKELAAVDQCLLELLGQKTSMVSFGGKQYYFWNIKDLWAIRNGIYARVMDERQARAGNMRSRLIVPTFVNL
jgi:hypothetical protein